MLKIKNLSAFYGKKKVLDDIDLKIKPHTWTMVIGPNGSGKSSLVKAIGGGLGYEGEILYKDRDIKSFKAKERARVIGILSQNHYPTFNFKVEEVVGLGRLAYKGLWGTASQEDKEMVEKAMDLTGITSLRDKSILEVSGGEVQRTYLAQVFAQDPKILILDEPTNHLDLKYEEDVFELLKAWVKYSDRSLVTVVHDLTLSRSYGDYGLLLKNGQVLTTGPIEKTMASPLLKDAYGTDVHRVLKKRSRIWI